MVITFVIVV